MTNFEKIKQLTVEEMAYFIYAVEEFGKPYCKAEHSYLCNLSCTCDDCRVDWLEREVGTE